MEMWQLVVVTVEYHSRTFALHRNVANQFTRKTELNILERGLFYLCTVWKTAWLSVGD
jgi:hypothetical protein